MSGSRNIGARDSLTPVLGAKKMRKTMIDAPEEHAMSDDEPARERIARRLHDAVERLRQDMDQVEFWTEVLSSLSRPVPDYNGGTSLLNRFELPPQNPNTTKRMSERGGDLGSNRSAETAEILSQGGSSNTGRSRH
jgi:hypothetical protein